MSTVRVEGLRELENALKELPKATGKNVLRRVLKARGEPVARAASSKAPRETGWLAGSATVGTKLSRRQARAHRQESRDDVYMFIGFAPSPRSIVQEFGGAGQPPQPFMRPAWDANKSGVLEGLKKDLWDEIEKAAKRLARRTARLAAKG